MNAPFFNGNRSRLSVSTMLTIIGSDLSQIRHEDELTWAQVGEVLGVGDDQAAKYARGDAEMGVCAYLRARRKWGTRITGRVQALVDGQRSRVADHEVLPDVLGCCKGIAEAIADGRICPRDLRTNRKEIEEAVNALYGLLSKLDEVAA